MKLYTLTRRQIVKKPLHEVFPFFSKPENLQLLNPKNLGFHILSPSPITMREGAIIDYVITIAGFPVRWTTMITCYEPPYRFVDLQLKGPYSYWHHTHTFSETDDGTIITDEVMYSMPLGAIGRIVHGLYVEQQLNTIFDRRSSMIETIFTDHIPFGTQQDITSF